MLTEQREGVHTSASGSPRHEQPLSSVAVAFRWKRQGSRGASGAFNGVLLYVPVTTR